MYRYNAAYKEINDVSLERMKMAVEYIDRYDIIIIDLCYLMSDIKRKGAAMIVSGKNSPKVRKIIKNAVRKLSNMPAGRLRNHRWLLMCRNCICMGAV